MNHKHKFKEGSRVNLNTTIVDFHYGEISPNIEVKEEGIVIASDYSKQSGEMSYLVQFMGTVETVCSEIPNTQIWFLESELV